MCVVVFWYMVNKEKAEVPPKWEFPQGLQNKLLSKIATEAYMGYTAGRHFVKQYRYTKKWGNSRETPEKKA